ncbi:TPA: hypothetical protein ACQUJI_000665 [Neisseria cinerea]|jgi:hypothetical protein
MIPFYVLYDKDANRLESVDMEKQDAEKLFGLISPVLSEQLGESFSVAFAAQFEISGMIDLDAAGELGRDDFVFAARLVVESCSGPLERYREAFRNAFARDRRQMDNSAMTPQNSRNRKHGTSTNRSPVQALTLSEIKSLREDLKQSVIQARKIIADIMAKRGA